MRQRWQNLSEEQRQEWRASMHKVGGWNKGVSTGPRPKEVCDRIAETCRGKPHPISQEKYDSWREAVSKGKMGHTQSVETRAKRGESLRKAYAEGRKAVSPRSGYGKGAFYESPFLGRVWLRSSSEVQRARELDAEGKVWFYELERFKFHMNGKMTTYCPDFWVLHGITRADLPQGVAPQDLVHALPPHVHLVIEDVKGWWKPTHRTYAKVTAFQLAHPEHDFRIVVRPGLGVTA